MAATLPRMNWNDLRYVLEVARAKAISPVAKALGVDDTTVVRRVRRVEQALGSKLFEPHWQPTEVAIGIVERAKRMEAEAVAIAESSAGVDAKLTGSVRITAIPLIASRLLLPAVKELSLAHPGLVLEVIAEPRNLSFAQHETDLALRHARPRQDQSAITRRMANLEYAVYGPTEIDARQLAWITYEQSMSELPHVAWINRAVGRQRRPPSLIVNDSELALNAIKAGIGKSLLPCLIADCESGLRRLSHAQPVLSREVWLLAKPGYNQLARIKTVATLLERILAPSKMARGGAPPLSAAVKPGHS